MKKLLLIFIPLICFFGCEPEEENMDDINEYYNCVSYMSADVTVTGCVSVSSESVIEWMYEAEEDCLNACGNGTGNGGGSGNNSIVVGNMWIGFVPNYGEIIFQLNDNGSLYIYENNYCAGASLDEDLGNWFLEEDTIKYTYISNGIEYTELFAIIYESSNSELKLVIDESSNSICAIYAEPQSDNCTYIPGDNFEKYLIYIGADDVKDNMVLTSNINTITSIYMSEYTEEDYYPLYNITGIEDFTALTSFVCGYCSVSGNINLTQNTNLTNFNCYECNISSINISQNLYLYELNLNSNNVYQLDASNNPNLMYLYLNSNNLNSLDLRHGYDTNLGLDLDTRGNDNLNCIEVDIEPSLAEELWPYSLIGGVDDFTYFSQSDCP